MNQTVTVNISGIVFHIEVDAYEELKKYLNKIKSYFKNSEECDEIMTDIEARIAELFNEKITSNNQVINANDVEKVITIMGKPEQYLNEDDIIEEQNYSSTSNYRRAKKLFRNPDDRMIGGVASGVAAYFGIDAIWLRLFFVIALFVGFGFLLYIILWIVIPEAKTASDKLQMKGDPVNIDNIGKTFKEEAEKVSENLKKNGQQYGKKAETVFVSSFNFLLQILKGFFKVLGKVFGFMFLTLGLVLLVTMLLWITVGDEIIFSITNNGVMGSVKSTELFNLIFASPDQFYLFIVGLLLTFGIPILVLIYAGLKLLFNIKTHFSVGLSMFILWIVGVLISIFLVFYIAKDQQIEGEIINTKILNLNYSAYYLNATKNKIKGNSILEAYNFNISTTNEFMYVNDIQLDIKKSKNDKTSIQVKLLAKGSSKKVAKEKAEAIIYKYNLADSLVNLNEYFATKKINKIRGQKVRLTLFLPVGKSIYLDKSLKHIIHNVDNVTDTWDNDMLGQKWIMLQDGLTCLNCDRIKGITSIQLDSIKAHKPVLEKNTNELKY